VMQAFHLDFFVLNICEKVNVESTCQLGPQPCPIHELRPCRADDAAPDGAGDRGSIGFYKYIASTVLTGPAQGAGDGNRGLFSFVAVCLSSAINVAPVASPAVPRGTFAMFRPRTHR
jgi:hypothetical protein